jgi:hypothetical protein
VNWQQDLQRLDEELAAGRLSAEDYRRQRDELLSRAASSGRLPQPEPAPASKSSPFPEPFRWDSPSESTQVIQPVPPSGDGPVGVPPGGVGPLGAAPGSVGPTGVPPGNVGPAGVPPGGVGPGVGLGGPPGSPGDPAADSADSTQVVHTEGQDAERTQVVPGQHQPPGPGGYNAPPWANYSEQNSAPPWANEAPPVIDPSAAWMRQGPEVFESAGGSGRGVRIAGLAIVALLLVGLIVTGVVYAVQRASSPSVADPGTSTAQTTSKAAPTTTTRELPEPPAPLPRPSQTPAALIDPPGQVRGGGGLLDLPKLRAAQLFSQPTLDALTDGGMTDGVLKTTTVDTSTVGMYALTLADAAAAKRVVEVIGRSNSTGGVRPDETREQKGVKVYATSESTKEAVFRAVYVLYDRAIELEVFGPDRPAVQALFDNLLQQQITHAPPTER